MFEIAMLVVSVAVVVAAWVLADILKRAWWQYKSLQHTRLAVDAAEACFADPNIPDIYKDAVYRLTQEFHNFGFLRAVVADWESDLNLLPAREDVLRKLQALPRESQMTLGRAAHHYGLSLSYRDMDFGPRYRQLLKERARLLVERKRLEMARADQKRLPNLAWERVEDKTETDEWLAVGLRPAQSLAACHA